MFVPFGGGVPFDLVAAAADGRLFRLQVKSGRLRNGCVMFNTCSTDHGNGRQDYRGRADYIAVHVAATDDVFMVPVDDCPSYVAALRLRAPRNNQRRRVRLASDYTFEAWVGGLERELAA